MKSTEKIWFDYQTAIKQAKIIDALANDLEANAQNNLGDALDTLSGNWTGDDAKKFRYKGQTLQGNMVASAKQLRATADNIRRTAKRVYQMEQANMQIIEQRGGHSSGGFSGGGRSSGSSGGHSSGGFSEGHSSGGISLNGRSSGGSGRGSGGGGGSW